MAAVTAIGRTLTFAAVAALTTASCSDGGTSDGGTKGGASASCAAVLKFRHETYVGTNLSTRPPHNRLGLIPRSHLEVIGIAIEPACIDTNHPGPQDTQVPVKVARIDGVSPAIAIAALPRGNVYVARGARIPDRLIRARWVRWVQALRPRPGRPPPSAPRIQLRPLCGLPMYAR